MRMITESTRARGSPNTRGVAAERAGERSRARASGAVTGPRDHNKSALGFWGKSSSVPF